MFLAPSLWAQISGITDITVPTANYVAGSNNDLVYEFQMAGSGTDTLEELMVHNTGSAFNSGNNYDLSNLLTVWYQPSSPTFSPGAAVSVGTLQAIDHSDWSNGPLYSTPSLNLPITALVGYVFVTANVSTIAVPFDTIQMAMLDSGVTLVSAGSLGTTQLINPDIQKIVAPGTVNGISSLGAPGAQVLPGTTNVPVLELSLSLSGTSLFQSIQVNNLGLAYSTDITDLKVWYQAAGGNFSATSAVELGTLAFITSNTYNNDSTPFNWNVDDGGGIYVTADLSATAISGHTLQFETVSGSISISGSAYANTLANAAAQTIVTPTPTPTFTNTQTDTHTPTATSTPTDTPTITSTETPTVTMTPTDTFTATYSMTYTATRTSTVTPTITNTATSTATFTITMTPTVTSTFTQTHTLVPTATSTPSFSSTPTNTGTASPTGSASPTPTPNIALYLDSNSFNPTNQSLGMDVRVDTAGEVKIIVCNMAGIEVRKVLDANMGVGNSRAVWDGRNSAGDLVGNGVYFVLIQTPSTKLVQKVIVLK